MRVSTTVFYVYVIVNDCCSGIRQDTRIQLVVIGWCMVSVCILYVRPSIAGGLIYRSRELDFRRALKVRVIFRMAFIVVGIGAVEDVTVETGSGS